MTVIPYIISYLAVGTLIAVSTWLNGTFADGKRLFAGLITLVAWPLIVFVAPESFFRNSRRVFFRSNEQTSLERPSPDSLKYSLEPILSSRTLSLTEVEANHLRKVVEKGESGVAYFGASSMCLEVLHAYWDFEIPPAAFYTLRSARLALQESEPDSEVLFSLREPDWYIGFSNEFLKSIARIDRKLQGRILEAIGKIGDDPVTPIGDTVKPLTGELSGLWRYRVGDDRLVYFPHLVSKRITLICFGPRGSIYECVPSTAALSGRSNGPSGRGLK